MKLRRKYVEKPHHFEFFFFLCIFTNLCFRFFISSSELIISWTLTSLFWCRATFCSSRNRCSALLTASCKASFKWLLNLKCGFSIVPIASAVRFADSKNGCSNKWATVGKSCFKASGDRMTSSKFFRLASHCGKSEHVASKSGRPNAISYRTCPNAYTSTWVCRISKDKFYTCKRISATRKSWKINFSALANLVLSSVIWEYISNNSYVPWHAICVFVLHKAGRMLAILKVHFLYPII